MIEVLTRRRRVHPQVFKSAALRFLLPHLVISKKIALKSCLFMRPFVLTNSLLAAAGINAAFQGHAFPLSCRTTLLFLILFALLPLSLGTCRLRHGERTASMGRWKRADVSATSNQRVDVEIRGQQSDCRGAA